MYNIKRSTWQTARQCATVAALLLITLFLGCASGARAQTTPPSSGQQSSAGSSAEDKAMGMGYGSPEAAGYVVGRIFGVLLCPALIIFVLYKAFSGKSQPSNGSTNTPNKP